MRFLMAEAGRALGTHVASHVIKATGCDQCVSSALLLLGSGLRSFEVHLAPSSFPDTSGVRPEVLGYYLS